jgi:hypothetical protein
MDHRGRLLGWAARFAALAAAFLALAAAIFLRLILTGPILAGRDLIVDLEC